MKETNVVYVKADRNGNIISQNPNKPEFGYFLVKGQEGLVSFSNGWANVQRARQCIVSAPWSLLEAAAESGLRLGDGSVVKLEEGAALKGKIVIRESVEQSDLFDVTKVDGNTGLKFRSGAHRKAQLPYAAGDQPIYQKKFFTENLEEQDVLVAATNVADVNTFTQDQLDLGNANLLADFVPTPAQKKAAAAKKLARA